MIVRNDKTDPIEKEDAVPDPIEKEDAADKKPDWKEDAVPGPTEKEDAAPKKDDNSADNWCCCDNKKVSDDEKLICLADDGHRTLLEVEDEKAKTPTDGFSIPVTVKTLRQCAGIGKEKSPQPCTEDCEKTKYLTFKQVASKSTFTDFKVPTEKWAKAGYKTKYYPDAEHGAKHALETNTGNIYAQVDDTSKYGLAKDQKKFCIAWEEYAYYKLGGMMPSWECVQKPKCVKYLTVEDPCGEKNVIRGDGAEETAGDLSVGGTLHKLVGRQGQCEEAESKEGGMSGAWSTFKGFTGSAGASSECPSDMFHSSKGSQGSPSIPYRFCDCDGRCK